MSFEAFNLTETDTALDTSDLDTYNFAGTALGTDVTGQNTRYTVVVILAHSSNNIDSVTIAGQAAAVVSDGATSAHHFGSTAFIYIAIADTTGQGTSGTVSITFSGAGSTSGVAIGVYRMVNPITEQANEVVIDLTPSSGELDLSLDIPTDGAAVAGVFQQEGGTSAWTGLTESFDNEVNTDRQTTAAFGGSAGTPHTITVQSTEVSPTQMKGIAASWEPLLDRILDLTLVTNTNTFFAPQVNLTIFATLFTNTSTFFNPQVNLVLIFSIFTNTSVFFAFVVPQGLARRVILEAVSRTLTLAANEPRTVTIPGEASRTVSLAPLSRTVEN